jgi:hypothetical protein
MDKHIDITIDFETCSLSANAAVITMAALPWKRNDEEVPFYNKKVLEPFRGYVDLRSCVVEGFDFDPETIDWWSRQNDVAKDALLKGAAVPVKEMLLNFMKWLKRTMDATGAETVCLWCQGMDVDIAILRNICRKFGFNLNSIVAHTYFRDCRTVILERAISMAKSQYIKFSAQDIMQKPSLAYQMFEPLPESLQDIGDVHDAMFDCIRSTWYTWQAMKV